MDNQRLLIWAFFAMMAWITWQTWQEDFAPQPATPPAGQAAQTRAESVPVVPESEIDVPELSAESVSEPVLPQAPAETSLPEAAVVRVSTDVFDVEISTAGGTLQGATLPDYPVAKDRPDEPVTLLDNTAGSNYGLIESGVRAADGAAEATHVDIFSAAQTSYDLGGADELVVPLTWTDASGVTVEKRYIFRRGSYRIDLEQVLSNNSGEEWRGAEYVRIKRHSAEQERSMFDVDSYSFIGPVIFDGKKSDKLDRDDLLEDGPYQYASQQGWLASIQHHFVRAVVPTAGVDYRYTIAVSGDVATSTAIRRNLVTIAPGATDTLSLIHI